MGVVAATLAILLRAALTPLWGTRYIFTFSFPAVVLAAWYGRMPAGLLCTAALAFGAAYYVEPRGTFTISGADDLLAVAVFALFGVLISIIVHRLHRQIALSSQLAEAARIAETERRAVLESIPDGFVVLDEHWKFTYANAQAGRFLDAAPESMIGSTAWERFPELAGTPIESMARRVAQSRVAEQVEHLYASAGRWLQVRIFPAARGIALLIQDATEQKRTLDKLRESTSTLQAIIEASDNVIFAKDREGRYTMVNGAMLRFLGLSREQVIGRTIFDLGRDRAQSIAIAEGDRRVIETGRPETIEQTFATPSGRVVYSSTRSPRFDEHGRVIGITGVATDITARKAIESDLRSANDSLTREVVERTSELVALSHHLMQVSEAEKAKLASDLHDALGGSLTTLVLALARLKHKSEPLSREQSTAFAQVESTVHDIVAMTRRIVGDLRPVTLDTLGLVPTLQDYIEKWSAKTGVEVNLSAPSTLRMVPADIALVLFRIVQESLTNVAKHAYATKVAVTLVSAHQELRVMVEDNGVGIGLNATRRGGSHGLLGMRERAAACGGTLSVDAGALGRGTRIELRIPLTRDDTTPDTESQERDAGD